MIKIKKILKSEENAFPTEDSKPILDDEINYGEKAWKLNKIMMGMNNEGAYYDSGWLYIWPDGETYEDCLEDFKDKEDFDELEALFISIYSYHDDEDEENNYHDDGLYNVDQETIDLAHEYDAKLGLDPIQVL